ncbi:hypothetical protein [Domibacillus indicus]|uniref:hypothetical protein n=1 Tax=Domibacillus indicus TaxID=1437523 RepID=UPI000617AA03|nr:hypothetical protein [Domibacillus indicus]
MDFKSVEMQVALPRTFDAAKSFHDHQQTAQATQYHAQAETEKKAEWRQKAVEESGDLAKTGERGHEQQQSKHQQQKKKQQEKTYAAHPYKGQQIDFSG